MTDNYTPTTAEVRNLYDERTRPGEFDRWLARHDAEVAAKARERAAQVAKAFIPDPHEEHEACEDCAMTRSVAAALRKIG